MGVSTPPGNEGAFSILEREDALPAAVPSCCLMSQGRAGGEIEPSNELSDGSSRGNAGVDGGGYGSAISSETTTAEEGDMLQGYKGRTMSALQHALVSEDHEVCLHLIRKLDH